MQKLIASLNRGGLWTPTDKAQQIFLKTEQHFRTRHCGQTQKIDMKNIAAIYAQDPEVVSSINTIVSEPSIPTDHSVSKAMIH